jgi:hypothetical protein
MKIIRTLHMKGSSARSALVQVQSVNGVCVYQALLLKMCGEASLRYQVHAETIPFASRPPTSALIPVTRPFNSLIE